MSETGLWRGFAPLLVFYGAGALMVQIDLCMIAPLGPGAPTAYLTLTRVAALDLVSMAATGAVASVFVRKARAIGEAKDAVAQISWLAAAIGAGTGALGYIFYPGLIVALTGRAELAASAASAAFWFSLSSPCRFYANAGAFALLAFGDGGAAARWKLFAVAAKIGCNYLFINLLGCGFAGCFISGFLIAVLSSIWIFQRLAAHGLRPTIGAPRWSGARSFLLASTLESQRLFWPQLAMSVSVALFSTPLLGHVDYRRLDAFSAGQMLIAFLLTPMSALTRFFTLRLANLPEARMSAFTWRLWMKGAPPIVAAAALLFVASESLGAIYRQTGPWWSALVEALALSLPIRYATNVMRAVLQARGAFATTAAADSFASWSVAIPLLALGLSRNDPRIAYLSLLAPEACCALWLAQKMPFSISRQAARMLRRVRRPHAASRERPHLAAKRSPKFHGESQFTALSGRRRP
ncbi:methanobactin export MATE transporter MbnM [Methylocystis sp. S23]